MNVTELARKVAAFDWQDAKIEHGKTDEPYQCLACGNQYTLDFDHDPSALCDPCAVGYSEAFARRIVELEGLINTPRTDDFFEAVRIEAAHQIERWGVEHDAGKRSEDWITLFMYLLGKAAKAHFVGDREKLLHHVVTVAAVALNWHRNATGENTLMRPGVAP